MKEASGELSMTVVVIVAVVAIMGIVSTFLLPKIQEYINTNWEGMTEDKTSDYYN